MDAQQNAAEPRNLDLAGIMHAIPHRFPMLMIDRVTDMVLEPLRSRRQERLG